MINKLLSITLVVAMLCCIALPASAQYRTSDQCVTVYAQGELGSFVAVYNPRTNTFERHTYTPSSRPSYVTTIPMKIPSNTRPAVPPPKVVAEKQAPYRKPTVTSSRTIPKATSQKGYSQSSGPLIIENPYYTGPR